MTESAKTSTDGDGADAARSHWLRHGTFNDGAFGYYEPLRRIRDHVESHLQEKLSLDAAARIACFERSYFSTFFRRKVGIPFSTWLGLVRIRKAAGLLAERDRCIAEVAGEVGLTLRTFERRFKGEGDGRQPFVEPDLDE